MAEYSLKGMGVMRRLASASNARGPIATAARPSVNRDGFDAGLSPQKTPNTAKGQAAAMKVVTAEP